MHESLQYLVNGITFTVGIFIGAALCRMATKKGRTELESETREHFKRVEDRLIGYVENSARMASAMESLVAMKDEERRR